MPSTWSSDVPEPDVIGQQSEPTSEPDLPPVLPESSMSLNLESGREQEDLLYAVRACTALRCLGRMFRSSNDESKYSEKVNHIHHFWSYSRHAPNFGAVSILLLYYNAVPSSLAGLVAAVVIALLLPLHWAGQHKYAGVIVMLTATCVTALVLTTWPCRQLVFLDKACICQDDEERKRRGILNLGCFLRSSHTMIVLWDPTYFTRLWCVFEIAAFLKLKAEGSTAQRSLKVLPVSYGVMTITHFWLVVCFLGIIRPLPLDAPPEVRSPRVLATGTLLIALIIFLLAAVASAWVGRIIVAFARQHCQLQEFGVRKADCFCCSSQHLHPETMRTIDCDRILIQNSVIKWFGDVANFEHFARSEIQTRIHESAYLPYRFVVFLLMPFAWDGLGASIWLMRSGCSAQAWELLVDRLEMAFLVGPMGMMLMWMMFARIYTRTVSKLRAAAYSTVFTGALWMVLLFAFRVSPTFLGPLGYLISAVLFSLGVVPGYWKHL